MQNSIDITIRPMRRDEIPAGMELKTLAGWNQTEADWQLFLNANLGGSVFVAVCDDRIVASTAAICFGTEMAWIGMVLVHPDYRRRGIATRLMIRILEQLGDCPTIKLDATPAGKQVYEKLGFFEESMLYRMTASSCPVSGSSGQLAPQSMADETEIHPIEPSDMPGIADFDRSRTGINRLGLLESLRRRTPDAALQIKRKGRVAAYCLGRPGTNFFHRGPILADKDADAARLATAVPAWAMKQPIVIDVPSIHDAFQTWLEERGFSVQRELIRMIRGQRNDLHALNRPFAICGPELG